jgi:hypothetical protein
MNAKEGMTDKKNKYGEGNKDIKRQKKEDRINETQTEPQRNLLISKFLILRQHVSWRT